MFVKMPIYERSRAAALCQRDVPARFCETLDKIYSDTFCLFVFFLNNFNLYRDLNCSKYQRLLGPQLIKTYRTLCAPWTTRKLKYFKGNVHQTELHSGRELLLLRK